MRIWLLFDFHLNFKCQQKLELGKAELHCPRANPEEIFFTNSESFFELDTFFCFFFLGGKRLVFVYYSSTDSLIFLNEWILLGYKNWENWKEKLLKIKFGLKLTFWFNKMQLENDEFEKGLHILLSNIVKQRRFFSPRNPTLTLQKCGNERSGIILSWNEFSGNGIKVERYH